MLTKWELHQEIDIATTNFTPTLIFLSPPPPLPVLFSYLLIFCSVFLIAWRLCCVQDSISYPFYTPYPVLPCAWFDLYQITSPSPPSASPQFSDSTKSEFLDGETVWP